MYTSEASLRRQISDEVLLWSVSRREPLGCTRLEGRKAQLSAVAAVRFTCYIVGADRPNDRLVGMASSVAAFRQFAMAIAGCSYSKVECVKFPPHRSRTHPVSHIDHNGKFRTCRSGCSCLKESKQAFKPLCNKNLGSFRLLHSLLYSRAATR